MNSNLKLKFNILSISKAMLITSTIGLTYAHYKLKTAESKIKDYELAFIKNQAADAALGQYAINMMYHSGAGYKLSDARKQTLARSIVKVANDVYDSPEHRRAFIAVIAIESGFQRDAQSPTGPKGLSQVAKAAFKEGLGMCGIPSANEEDVWDTDINLYAGACYFRNLLEKNNNDPFIAIVAYNKGPNSDSIKTYSKNGNLNDIEALKYVAKFNFLKRTVPEGKVANIPAYEANSTLDKVKLNIKETENIHADRPKSREKKTHTAAKSTN